MTTLIIRDLDDSLAKILKREALKRDLSVNRFLHQLIAQALRKTTPSADAFAPRNNLSALAGVWSVKDVREFAKATQAFGEIEAEAWK